jgi:hypothetical protein
LSLKPQGLGRIAAAIGGFLILIGIVLMAVFALILLDRFSIETLLTSDFLMLFMTAMLVVGVLDLVSAMLLLRG